jgi:hypothetical protein
MKNLARYRKAVLGFVIPAIVVIGEALIREGFMPVNVNWSATLTMAAVAAVTTAVGVYKVRNATGTYGGSEPLHPVNPDTTHRAVDPNLGGLPNRPVTRRDEGSTI